MQTSWLMRTGTTAYVPISNAAIRCASMQAQLGAWCTGICWIGCLLNEALCLCYQLMITVSAQSWSVSSAAVCQLTCIMSTRLWYVSSAQLQDVSSAAPCQLRWNLSSQLHHVGWARKVHLSWQVAAELTAELTSCSCADRLQLIGRPTAAGLFRHKVYGMQPSWQKGTFNAFLGLSFVFATRKAAVYIAPNLSAWHVHS